MTLEILAGRLVAPYLGVSVYTWTSVIGVVLAGIAAGNLTGGWLADRRSPRSLLLWALYLAGASALLAGWSVTSLGTYLNQNAASLMLGSLTLSFVAFFPPSFFIGMLTPTLIKLALQTLNETGRVSGRIYGIGTAGAILGTFATGFFFISYFGTIQTVLGVASALVLLGVASSIWLKKFRPITTVLFFALFVWAAFSASPLPCEEESLYYCLNLIPFQDELGAGVILRLDHFNHTRIYPDDHRKLGDLYQQALRVSIRYFNEKHGFYPKTLIIGGGGYYLPRFLQYEIPETKPTIVEIDSEVTRLMENIIGPFEFAIFHDDARVFLNRLSGEEKFDVILGDAFQDFTVPWQLTTREFSKNLKSHLSEKGFYAVNVVDRPGGPFIASVVKTVGEVFPHIAVLAEKLPSREDKFINQSFIVLGLQEPMDKNLWKELRFSYIPEDERLAVKFLSDEAVRELISRGKLLTDNYAPVEQMLSPIFRASQRDVAGVRN